MCRSGPWSEEKPDRITWVSDTVTVPATCLPLRPAKVPVLWIIMWLMELDAPAGVVVAVVAAVPHAVKDTEATMPARRMGVRMGFLSEGSTQDVLDARDRRPPGGRTFQTRKNRRHLSGSRLI